MYAYVAGQVGELWAEGLADAVFVDGQWRFLVHPQGEPVAERAVGLSGIVPGSSPWRRAELEPAWNCASSSRRRHGAARNIWCVYWRRRRSGDRDVENMGSLFTKMANEPPENFSTSAGSWTFRGSPPKASDIIASIQARASQAGKDDLLVVSFACHGAVPNGQFRLQDSKGDVFMTPDQINTALADAQCQVLLVVDACQSGAIIPSINTSPNLTILTGCKANQVCCDSTTGGAMTSCLINRLQDNRNEPLDATGMADLAGAVTSYNKSSPLFLPVTACGPRIHNSRVQV